MKRRPACKRVENDDTLVYCRADGTPLVSDSGSVSAGAGTVRFGSSPAASERETSFLPQHVTDAGISRSTGPTTVLDRQQTISKTHANRAERSELERSRLQSPPSSSSRLLFLLISTSRERTTQQLIQSLCSRFKMRVAIQTWSISPTASQRA